MGTRLFCDHCGNTVQKFTTLSYGGLHDRINSERNMLMQGSVGGGGGLVYVGSLGTPSPSDKHTPIVDVELCDHCVPIWLKRVEALTKQSDTE